MTIDDDDTMINESSRIKKLVVRMQGEKKVTDINEVRYFFVMKKLKPPAKATNNFDKLKDIDAAAIPPCRNELMHHIRRAAYVARMWAGADNVGGGLTGRKSRTNWQMKQRRWVAAMVRRRNQSRRLRQVRKQSKYGHIMHGVEVCGRAGVI